MEKKEIDIVLKLSKSDDILKSLWEEHLELEKRLNEFNKKLHLSSDEILEKKSIQKLKLAGKDKILKILSEYRQKEL